MRKDHLNARLVEAAFPNLFPLYVSKFPRGSYQGIFADMAREAREHGWRFKAGVPCAPKNWNKIVGLVDPMEAAIIIEARQDLMETLRKIEEGI